jgi:hypothetical protein
MTSAGTSTVVSGQPIGRSRRLSGAKQRELCCSRQTLDACLLAASSRAVGHRHRKLELDGQPAGCIAAGDARSVVRKPALKIDRPARVERAVATAQHIHPGLGHRGTASPRRGQVPAHPRDSGAARVAPARGTRNLPGVSLACGL